MKVAHRILTRAERWALAEPLDLPWPLVLFSAKEATYKAISQANRRWCGLQGLTFEQSYRGVLSGCFSYEMEGLGRYVCARYGLTDHFVVTCVELAHTLSEGQ
jgi:4'-phosphopantetheinyl transferase EntD